MQFVTIGQALDGADCIALGLHREHQAGPHRRVIDDDGAGAADAVIAADMRAGLPAILANGIGKRAARLNGNLVILAVDGQGDGGFIGHLNLRSSPRKRGSSKRGPLPDPPNVRRTRLLDARLRGHDGLRLRSASA